MPAAFMGEEARKLSGFLHAEALDPDVPVQFEREDESFRYYRAIAHFLDLSCSVLIMVPKSDGDIRATVTGIMGWTEDKAARDATLRYLREQMGGSGGANGGGWGDIIAAY